MTPADRITVLMLMLGTACISVGFYMVSLRFGLIACGFCCMITAYRFMRLR
jgi:hypothetical protein